MEGSPRKHIKRPQTPFTQKLCFSIGHFFCDLQAVAWFSYILLYFTKVVGLSSKIVGIIWVCEKILDASGSFFFSHASNKWTVPYLSQYCGKGKAWHLIGTVFLTLFVVLLWTSPRQFDENLPQWVMAVYFVCVLGFHDLAWETTSLTHMSMVAEIVKRPSEVVELHALRSTFTYVGGLYVYGVTWILLRQDSDQHLSPKQWKDFMYLGVFVVVSGTIASFIFHVGTKKPDNSELQNDRDLKSIPNRINFSNDDYEKKSEPLQTFTRKRNNECTVESQLNNAVANKAFESDYSDFIGVDDEPSGSSLKDAIQTKEKGSYFLNNQFVLPEISASISADDGQSAASVSSGYYDDSSIDGWTDSCSEPARDCTNASYNEVVIFDPSYTSLKIRKEPCSGPVEAVSQERLPCAVEEPGCRDKTESKKDDGKTTKQWKEWLKDRRMYKIAIIFMCAKISQTVPLSYFPLYLTDALHLEKEAIAYFPLVVLASSLCASLSAKKINKLLGNKWTYCLAGGFVVSALTWFYFLPPSSRTMVYPCAIILGGGSCVMYVTALSVATDLIGSNKGSGAFVFAFLNNADKLTCGVMIGAIQEFYPEGNPDGSCSACGHYVRHVFTMVPGIAAIMGFVAVMVFFPASIGCSRIVHTTDSETQTKDTSIEVDNRSRIFLPKSNTVEQSPLEVYSTTTIPCDELENPTSHRINTVVLDITDDEKLKPTIRESDLQTGQESCDYSVSLTYNTKL